MGLRGYLEPEVVASIQKNMYTATLKNTEIRKSEGRIDASVELSDGVTTFTKVFTIGLRESDVMEAVKRQVKHFIEGLENADQKVAPVATGVLDLTAVPSSVATQAELDRNVWIDNYQRLVGAKKMLDLGIFTETEPKYVALKDKVVNGFKPSYINFV